MRVVLALALASTAACTILPRVLNFATPPASAARNFCVQAGSGLRRTGNCRTGHPAFAVGGAVTEATTDLRPRPPNSTQVMTKQAADAAMNAYRDGITRQTVRLRLDAAYSPEDAYFAGITAKLKGTLPLAESFTKKLWGGDMLKAVRTQGVDREVATLCYRQADEGMYDAAVFFLTGRSLVVTEKLRGYFRMMGDRLVVLLNSEDAADPFKVQNRAKDWVIGEDADAGAEVVEAFKEITYYYTQGSVNNWQLIQFHAYPHPWEIWVETLDYNLEKIAEFDNKPSYDEITQATLDYEAKNNIPYAKKLSKMMKDQGSEFSAFGAAQADPGPDRRLW